MRDHAAARYELWIVNDLPYFQTGAASPSESSSYVYIRVVMSPRGELTVATTVPKLSRAEASSLRELT